MKNVEEALAILEKLREKWSHNSQFLENTAKYNDDLAAVLNNAQKRVIDQCSNDVYGAICEIRDLF